MNCFVCPICKSPLGKHEKSYICSKDHTFDISREGYVNLLPSGKANSAVPGDNKDMVNARTLFLQTGSYDIFAEKIADIISSVSTQKHKMIFDAGCGQGHYDRIIKDKIGECSFFGIDISKFAIKYAASHNKDISYAVAGVYDMPVRDKCADVILSIFSPIAEKEFYRIASDGAYLIIAVPGERHLFGLKEILYDTPYENEIIKTDYPGFDFVDRVPVKSHITLSENDKINALFAMTPYYWKTGISGHERLKNTHRLDTEIHFDILVYKKK